MQLAGRSGARRVARGIICALLPTPRDLVAAGGQLGAQLEIRGCTLAADDNTQAAAAFIVPVAADCFGFPAFERHRPAASPRPGEDIKGSLSRSRIGREDDQARDDESNGYKPREI